MDEDTRDDSETNEYGEDEEPENGEEGNMINKS